MVWDFLNVIIINFYSQFFLVKFNECSEELSAKTRANEKLSQTLSQKEEREKAFKVFSFNIIIYFHNISHLQKTKGDLKVAMLALQKEMEEQKKRSEEREREREREREENEAMKRGEREDSRKREQVISSLLVFSFE